METKSDIYILEPSPRNKRWLIPAYCDVRLGFEVTAYVYVR